MGDQKDFSMVFLFAVVTLLNCCQASKFLLPRVSRTDDAIIIDFDGSGYDAPYQSKTPFGQVANPGFIPVPSFGPYPMMFRQPSGWPYPSVYPSSLNPAGVPIQNQFYGDEEEPIDVKQAPATSTCGVGPTTMPKTGSLASQKVAGGVEAKKGSWPFMVALRQSGTASDASFCSGSLISDTKVLLAAQCLEKMSLNEFQTVTALIGMHAEAQTDVQMTRRVTKVVVHEKYNAFNFANDIAILTLEYPVPLSKTFGPVCLPPASPEPDQYVGQDAVAVGWGNVADDFLNLQQAKTSIMANDECKFDTTIGKYVTENSTCITTTTDIGPFTCNKDIGGPVVMLPSPGAWTIVGINSYTTKDCKSGGLKTRVSAYIDWIKKYMK